MEERLPNADVVQVVRCKDCVYWVVRHPYVSSDDWRKCYKQIFWRKWNFFCADGEREDDAVD